MTKKLPVAAYRPQAFEVQIAPIHHIEGPRFGNQLIQHVDLVEFAIADEDERRNVAAQIQECVQFDRRALVARNGAQGNTDRHRSMVVASRA